MKLLLVRKATRNHLIKSNSLEQTQSPVSGFGYARNRVCNAEGKTKVDASMSTGEYLVESATLSHGLCGRVASSSRNGAERKATLYQSKRIVCKGWVDAPILPPRVLSWAQCCLLSIFVKQVILSLPSTSAPQGQFCLFPASKIMLTRLDEVGTMAKLCKNQRQGFRFLQGSGF